jgi:glutamate dehydrogenase (NAD(P)+)
MADAFEFADELGPAKIIQIYEPSIQLKGVLVVDNVAAGPSIGGLRIAPDVSTAECFRLARAMSLKNAAAALPHGGGKSVLYADTRLPPERKEELIRAMARALRHCQDYIFGPDMGTDEVCMAWVKSEIGRAVGLPREIGGIPLDEIGATGWGVLHATEVAAEFCGLELAGARVAVQGFGSVGQHAARFLVERGCRLVAAADSSGTVQRDGGLDVDALLELKQAGRSVVDYSDGKILHRDEIVGVECEIWIPAARPDVLHEGNVDQLRAKLVVSGANIPATEAAERKLEERGVLTVPDFIANAGGVICAAMEYRGSSEASALAAIKEKIRQNTRLVLESARSRRVSTRKAAIDLSVERIQRAMEYRRGSIH